MLLQHHHQQQQQHHHQSTSSPAADSPPLLIDSHHPHRSQHQHSQKHQNSIHHTATTTSGTQPTIQLPLTQLNSSGTSNVVYPASALGNLPHEVLLGLVQSAHLQLHSEGEFSIKKFLFPP